MVNIPFKQDIDTLFNDIDLSFSRNRRTNDVVSFKGADAIINSLKNLINLNFYEKKFHPSIGSNVRKLLFDNITPIVSNHLKNAIAEVIVNYEPRINLIDVVVVPDPTNNRYTTTIYFSLKDRGGTMEVSMFLHRIR